MKKVFLILPTQLFYQNSKFLDEYDLIILIEDEYYINSNIHKIKYTMHKDSCKLYLDSITHDNKKLTQSIIRNDNNKYYMYHPTDKAMVYKYKYCEFLETPGFILGINEIKDFYTNNQTQFYKMMRKRLNILMEDNKPAGNRWSYDDENRFKYPNDFSEDLCVVTETTIPPTTRKIAMKNLTNFTKYKLSLFGPYQDAMNDNILIGFHSYLSAPLNIGLITPCDVIREVMKYDIPLQSLEGFIRQIIGWREYIRMHYLINGDNKAWSYLKHMNNHIDDSWYKGTTDIDILNWSIKRVINYAYVPHIERLMLLNNLAILYRIRYEDIKKWFINMFIDGYDWAMLNISMNVNYLNPNKSDRFMTRVYLTNGVYLKKMGLKINKNDDSIIRKLYSDFIFDNKKILNTDYRTASYIKRMINE